ncbi:MAG: hypothetical protein JWO12_1203 [Frankiales bacterium]|nr:hypothetical protein [Frankiales bacterium]
MHAALANLLAAKVLAVTVGAASVGGVAVAAATDSLPDPVQSVAHDVAGAPAPSATEDAQGDDATETADAPEATESEAPDAAEAPETAKAAEPQTAAPHPNLKGLCQAYGSGNKATHGKALQSPAFTVLITAAGGKDGVAAYCTALKAASPHGKATEKAKPHKPAKVHKPKKDKAAKQSDDAKAETDSGSND